MNEQTLRNWVNAYRTAHADEEPPLSVSERAELRQLKDEVRELRMEREFLKKAAAYVGDRCQVPVLSSRWRRPS